MLYDAQNDQMAIFNEQRAHQSFYPASTFKLPNSLIGLHTQAVQNVDQIFYQYDTMAFYHFLSCFKKIALCARDSADSP